MANLHVSAYFTTYRPNFCMFPNITFRSLTQNLTMELCSIKQYLVKPCIAMVKLYIGQGCSIFPWAVPCCLLSWLLKLNNYWMKWKQSLWGNLQDFLQNQSSEGRLHTVKKVQQSLYMIKKKWWHLQLVNMHALHDFLTWMVVKLVH